jgi:hypothetical protein
MRRIDFYFHDGCLSQPSLLLLAKDIEALYPTWTVTVHQLAGHDLEALGFPVLPAVVLDGQIVATGIPSKAWLLQKVGEWAWPDQ